MMEMLLQSHLGELHLLPALPDVWAAGSIKGLKARGDFEVSMSWNNHRLTYATVQSLAGGPCKIRTATPVAVKGIAAKTGRDAYGYTLQFNTEKGKTYVLASLKK
jgi:alpha-L-fucosidase 2